MEVVFLLVKVVVEVVKEVVVLVVQIRPDEPSNIPSLSAVEVPHAPQSVWCVRVCVCVCVCV